jgi:hypothetical protein
MAALATLGDAVLYRANSDLVEPYLRSTMIPIDRIDLLYPRTGEQLE